MSLIDILKDTLKFNNIDESLIHDKSQPTQDNSSPEYTKPTTRTKKAKKVKNDFTNVSNDDNKDIHKAEKAMDKGKSVTFSQPMSERYPNYQDQSGESKLDKMTVSSTAIDTIKYDPRTRIANVRFVNGNKFYAFPDVPPEEISRWMRARSKGKYYNSDFKQYSVKGFRG